MRIAPLFLGSHHRPWIPGRIAMRFGFSGALACLTPRSWLLTRLIRKYPYKKAGLNYVARQLEQDKSCNEVLHDSLVGVDTARRSRCGPLRRKRVYT